MAWNAYHLEQFRHCLRRLAEGLAEQAVSDLAVAADLAQAEPAEPVQPEPALPPVLPLSQSDDAPLPSTTQPAPPTVPLAAAVVDKSLHAGSFFASLPWQAPGARPERLSIGSGQAAGLTDGIAPTDNPILAATVQALQTARQEAAKPTANIACSDFFAGLPWHGIKETSA